MAKRIKMEKLQPGDIILTASHTKAGKVVRFATGGAVSHAMIYVQHGSIIDSTSRGVQARNLQREFFNDDEDVFGFRLKESLSPAKMNQVINFARSEIGARYSVSEAARSVLRTVEPRNKRQFCSRLVARAYNRAGVSIVADPDYCTPDDIRLSRLLNELTDITETVSEEEIAMWRNRVNPIQMTEDAQNEILEFARSLDPKIENFSDLDQMVREHPEWDDIIANAYIDSGYLAIWEHERNANPWRYDLHLMESISDAKMLTDLKAVCISTIQEAYSGGVRFSINLAGYEEMQRYHPRKTYCLLINLYKILVKNDHLWRSNARAWLLKYHPEDVEKYMERIPPHSDLWFSIVDKVEPVLGHIARASIKNGRSVDVCSSCGDDPVEDYRIANADEAMPGVPSLRLCKDCLSIRRGYGETLEVIS